MKPELLHGNALKFAVYCFYFVFSANKTLNFEMKFVKSGKKGTYNFYLLCENITELIRIRWQHEMKNVSYS